MGSTNEMPASRRDACGAPPRRDARRLGGEAGRGVPGSRRGGGPAARSDGIGATVRFDAASAVIVGRWNDGEGGGFEVGTPVPYSDPEGPGPTAPPRGRPHRRLRRRTGRSGRMTRVAGYRSSVAAPIIAGGRPGARSSSFRESRSASDAEQRLRRLREARRTRARERRGPRSADCLARAHRRSRRGRAASDSSATSTTAPSSASSPSPSTCGSPRNACTTTRRLRRRCSTASART